MLIYESIGITNSSCFTKLPNVVWCLLLKTATISYSYSITMGLPISCSTNILSTKYLHLFSVKKLQSDRILLLSLWGFYAPNK